MVVHLLITMQLLGSSKLVHDETEELSEEGDISLREEDDYMELVKEEDYDIVFADPMMKRMTEDAYKMAGTGCVGDAYETERKEFL